jgi:transposase
LHRVELSPEQAEELVRRTRAADIKPRNRDRLEMVRLCAAGYRVPVIARLLRIGAKRVRHWLRGYRAGGFDALRDQPHLGRPGSLQPVHVQALREEFARANRTWTARQIADWLAEHHDLRLHPDHLATLLKRARLSYKRTERSLAHKQDPAAVAAAESQLAELEKGGSGSARSGAPRPSRLRADVAHQL